MGSLALQSTGGMRSWSSDPDERADVFRTADR